MKRYEKLAAEITQLIHSGVLVHGEKAPSIRQASCTYSVSPSTVFQAYYLLESRGLLRAKERSGYFVCNHSAQRLDEPQITQQHIESHDVGVSELIFSVLDSLRDASTVPFGSAFPSLELFPLARLARSLSSSMKTMPAHAIISDMTDGNPNLRRQIALRYSHNGMFLPPNELIITNGALEALSLCLQCITEPGDLVAIEAPAFYACLQMLERLQLKAVEIPVHPREGIDLVSLQTALASLPIKVCWLMSNLQNPIGASMDEEKKQALYELIRTYQVPLIEDDVYAELYFTNSTPRSIKSYDRSGLVMHCSSFSKCLAPGYRVGWVAAGRFAEQIKRLRLMTTISPAIPSQAALADYLQHGGYDLHLRRLRHALERQQAAMLNAAERYFPRGTRVTRPTGGYFLWFELPNNIDSLTLFQQALHQGISLAPGPIFSATQRFKNCIRLSYGHPWDDRCEQAMQQLGQLMHKLRQT